VAVLEAVIAAGLGFRAGCSAEQLGAALAAALGEHGLDPSQIACLCVPAFKRSDKSLIALAALLEKPLQACSLSALHALPLPTLTQSSEILRRYGVGSLSEACALYGALAHGREARLLAPRLIAGSVTCALAISEERS
jgi:cobalt-precorrin 5A hydrolase